MKYTEQDIKELQLPSFDKAWFLDFLNRVKLAVFDPATLTPENLNAKKEAISILEEFLEKPFMRGKANKPAATNQDFL